MTKTEGWEKESSINGVKILSIY